MTRENVRRNIKKLGLKKVMKPKCHFIPAGSIEKRAARAYGLYKLLRGGKWKNVITSDEAMFTVQHSRAKRDIQYISKESKRSTAAPLETKSHAKSLMVWAAFSHHGALRPIFVDPGAKVNRTYYINQILKPMMINAPELYPGGDYTFQQDSASSHTARDTVQFLLDNNITFIPPDKWLPNSPYCAPCDYYLWGYLKSKVYKHKVENVNQLKRAISFELKNIPQFMLDNALRSWPGLCSQIHNEHGGHIEKFH